MRRSFQPSILCNESASPCNPRLSFPKPTVFRSVPDSRSHFAPLLSGVSSPKPVHRNTKDGWEASTPQSGTQPDDASQSDVSTGSASLSMRKPSPPYAVIVPSISFLPPTIGGNSSPQYLRRSSSASKSRTNHRQAVARTCPIRNPSRDRQHMISRRWIIRTLISLLA